MCEMLAPNSPHSPVILENNLLRFVSKRRLGNWAGFRNQPMLSSTTFWNEWNLDQRGPSRPRQSRLWWWKMEYLFIMTEVVFKVCGCCCAGTRDLCRWPWWTRCWWRGRGTTRWSSGRGWRSPCTPDSIAVYYLGHIHKILSRASKEGSRSTFTFKTLCQTDVDPQ